MKIKRHPPINWVEERPAWCTKGRKIAVVTDPDSPDYGRAAGFFSPREGSVVYANDPTGRRMAPAMGPDKGKWFHAGEWDYTTADGGKQSVKVGSICINGGHSDSVPELATRPYTAEKMSAARDYLQRSGRWQDRHGELVLHGRTIDVPGEGILFLGAAYEWASPMDLDVINATTVSPEFWPNPINGQEQFIGAARVLRTALPGPDYGRAPIAADFGPDDFYIVVRSNGDDGEWKKLTPEQMAVIRDPRSRQLETRPAPEPVRAEVTETDIERIMAEIAGLREELNKRIDEVSALVFEQEAATLDTDDLTSPDLLTVLIDKVNKLSDLVENHGDNHPSGDIDPASATTPYPLPL